MIPVEMKPEPTDFDVKVRQKGLEWLKKHGVPKLSTDLPSDWRACLYDLWEAYAGVCAYYCFYFEYVSGAQSVDHYVAKSSDPWKAYDWDNYRLACRGANTSKNKWDDVLDPFEIKKDTFLLDLNTGEIFINPNIQKPDATLAGATMDRLELDSSNHRRMRSKHWAQYLRHKDQQTLRELNPFVYYEASRQGLL